MKNVVTLATRKAALVEIAATLDELERKASGVGSPLLGYLISMAHEQAMDEAAKH